MNEVHPFEDGFNMERNLPEVRKNELIETARMGLEIFDGYEEFDRGNPENTGHTGIEKRLNDHLAANNKLLRRQGIGVFYKDPIGLFSWGAMFGYVSGTEMKEGTVNPFFFRISVGSPFALFDGSGEGAAKNPTYSEIFLARLETPLFRRDDYLTLGFLRKQGFCFRAAKCADTYFKRLELDSGDLRNPERIARAACQTADDLCRAVLHLPKSV